MHRGWLPIDSGDCELREECPQSPDVRDGDEEVGGQKAGMLLAICVASSTRRMAVVFVLLLGYRKRTYPTSSGPAQHLTGTCKEYFSHYLERVRRVRCMTPVLFRCARMFLAEKS